MGEEERGDLVSDQSLDQVIEASLMDWYYPSAREHRRVLALELMRIRGLDLEGLDDRIRDVMDIFCCSPHSCDGDPELRKSCVACLYIELNKALLPGWSPRAEGH